jgi:hypothetical protein
MPPLFEKDVATTCGDLECGLGVAKIGESGVHESSKCSVNLETRGGRG